MGGICVRFGIDLVHLHHISGCRAGLIAALTELDIAFGYTVHDVNFACPTITFRDPTGMFCGAQTDPAVCQPCLAAQSEYAGADIVAWRAAHRGLLDRATFAIAPSRWAADTLHRYYPQREVRVIAHGAQGEPARSLPSRQGLAMPDDDIPVIALLGAVGPDKGARRVERLVQLTRERGLRLRWVLIGYLDRRQEPGQDPDAVFTVHGRYDVRDLPGLIAHYGVRLVAYPSAGPETFSYTLSEAWAAGRPVLVPPIGALAERVAGTGGGWILSEADWRSEERMLERIVGLLAPANRDAFAAVTERARAAPLPTLAAMAEATAQVYAGALLRVPPRLALPPIATKRCLEALHYAPWMPPAIVRAPAIVQAPAVPPIPAAAPAHARAAKPSTVPAAAHDPASASSAMPSRDWVARLAHAGIGIRHTLAGRVLYQLTPKPLLAALKARLHG
jgi:glycosyltransferase involved in cell wall biosynthesis